ncbi:glycoside hydrolase family 88 protein [Algibacter lectus]|uniref:Alpha-1,2-mannosidase n=2 Tax=Algibacter lectus TaxID=221126 RepID=A0A090VGA8_9FLAO|nr:glycoside hydrolase family 88 protein [Algibacter lectus]MWW25478.1 glucuronyl hydrolase [Algibacter lectus]TDY61423.1 unsaturated chondroitin disaccharide hydrolase [Algibacter lectus]GAL63083.1 alpha-1,2-mannosidase [Algibacter lectus]
MRLIKSILFLMLFVCFSCNSVKKETAINQLSKFDVNTVLNQNVEKIKTVTQKLTFYDSFPRHIDENNKQWSYVKTKDWCSGFYPGILWYAYEESGDEVLKNKAIKFTETLKTIAYSPARNHDIGFQLYCSYGNGFRLTGNQNYKEILLAAADTLATLYNPKVGSILSWPSQIKRYKHNTIIDNMMNLELLFWAAKNGGDKSLYDIAKSHAEQTMKYLVREDGSAFHVGSFDIETGAFLQGYTHQGYANESMWARGQGWGIYGFAMAYRETGDSNFLNTAIKLSDKFLDRLPEDGIPFWDFDDPKIPNAPKDASAAAVAACGLMELSGLVQDEKLKSKYFNGGKALVENLSSSAYLSNAKNDALLLHSTGNHPKNKEMDVPIIYADYYYMEALLRLKKLENI